MDEYIDSLGRATIFSALYASSKYWQIKMDERDKDKTTIVNHGGLYRYTQLVFGLKIAPENFQTEMVVISAALKCQYVVVYIQNVIIVSPSSKDHITHVKTIFEISKNPGMTMKLKNAISFQTLPSISGMILHLEAYK